MTKDSTQDKSEIADLLIRWGYARDCADWETLRQCFHDDATIHISWISGPATTFVERSIAMTAARKPGAHNKHIIESPWVLIDGDRAFARTHATLYIRGDMEGQAVDVTSWLRFFDLLECRDNVWRLVKRSGVYEKDRLDPVDPRGFPDGFFDGMDLSRYPESAKFLCYMLQRAGFPPSSENIVSVFSEGEQKLLNEGQAWLSSAKDQR